MDSPWVTPVMQVAGRIALREAIRLYFFYPDLQGLAPWRVNTSRTGALHWDEIAMTDPLHPAWHRMFGDAGQDSTLDTRLADVPLIHDQLPDGRDSLVYGDVSDDTEFTSRQGDNPQGFKGTCGLVSCTNVLREFGVEVSEADVVRHALVNLECNVDVQDADASGGTTPDTQARLLGEFGVPASVERHGSLESLAAEIEAGHGVIVGVNAGLLWENSDAWDFGQANHAVTVRAVARDPATGELQGFFIADSGRGLDADARRFVSADLMDQCHLAAGGLSVVTEGTWSEKRSAALTNEGML